MFSNTFIQFLLLMVSVLAILTGSYYAIVLMVSAMRQQVKALQLDES
jgi:hypothetical protein